MSSGLPLRPRPERLTRAAFRHFRAITTRWSDNDVFGHVNNVVYYAWFDTAVTGWLLENKLLDPHESPVICVVVETNCIYFESVAFPDEVTVGIAIERIGKSSVTYRIGVFRNDGELAAAQGHFTHVYVTRAEQKPTAIPEHVRDAMDGLVVVD
ncbi:MAG: acyl-CoA thioesterase [Bosea sp. (in: a-proteobacteria)]